LARGARDGSDADAGEDRQRLDKWLVYARFARTRSAASALVEKGRVRVNGSRVTNPARPVAAGDVLTLALPHATRVVRILGVAARRDSFALASALYEDVTA
jgi:ribosome-associated heat shock protein Hsp15